MTVARADFADRHAWLHFVPHRLRLEPPVTPSPVDSVSKRSGCHGSPRRLRPPCSH